MFQRGTTREICENSEYKCYNLFLSIVRRNLFNHRAFFNSYIYFLTVFLAGAFFPPLRAAPTVFLTEWESYKIVLVKFNIAQSLTLLLRTIALNLSKSVSLALLAFKAILWAVVDFSHLPLRSNFSRAALRVAVLGDLMMGTLNLVKESLLMGMICLSTPEMGFSTRT